jgi:hypothetical protein
VRRAYLITYVPPAFLCRVPSEKVIQSEEVVVQFACLVTIDFGAFAY